MRGSHDPSPFGLFRISRNLLRLQESHPFPGNPPDAPPPPPPRRMPPKALGPVPSPSARISQSHEKPRLRLGVPAIMFRQPHFLPARFRSGVLPDARAIERLAPHADAVLDARVAHPGATLADLYDPDLMPPNLRKTHQDLDRTVDRLYRRAGFASERERVEHLFILYEKMRAPLEAGVKRKPRRTRRNESSWGSDRPSAPNTFLAEFRVKVFSAAITPIVVSDRKQTRRNCHAPPSRPHGHDYWSVIPA